MIGYLCNPHAGMWSRSWRLGLETVSRRNFKRLGLVSVSWKCGKVSVSVSSRTENQTSRSRLGLAPQGLVYKSTNIHFFTVFLETLTRPVLPGLFDLSNTFRTLEGIVSTFYWYNEICFTSLWSITSITSSHLLNKTAEAQFNNENDQWLKDLVTLIIKLMKGDVSKLQKDAYQ
jgi:hypothetical protein